MLAVLEGATCTKLEPQPRKPGSHRPPLRRGYCCRHDETPSMACLHMHPLPASCSCPELSILSNDTFHPHLRLPSLPYKGCDRHPRNCQVQPTTVNPSCFCSARITSRHLKESCHVTEPLCHVAKICDLVRIQCD